MKLFKRTFIYLLLGLLIYIFLGLITPYSSYLRNRAIKNQIHYLSDKMNHGADDQLQKRYPEGKVFSNALLALSIIKANEKTSLHKSSEIIDQCILKLLSQRTRDYFGTHLTIKHGAFYNGWTNFVLKKYINSKSFADSKIKSKILAQHRKLSQIILDSSLGGFQLIDSYTEAVWSGDNLACIASLDETHDGLKKEWLTFLENESGDPDKLCFHINGNKNEVRGSSQALCIFFINEIDPKHSKKRNQKYKERFACNRLGIQFIREYQKHETGAMDIDSGPILFGLGAVATIMNIKTQSAIGQSNKFTWSFLNVLGLGNNCFGSKHYLLKKEMMFDLFMLWSLVEMN